MQLHIKLVLEGRGLKPKFSITNFFPDFCNLSHKTADFSRLTKASAIA
ncbi:MAG: hypothetical protein ACYTXT_07875 [Nostoc sp.]|nr:hypothetical protein [Nostoc sp. JL31]MBN3891511.1 hypothetical protein [Nostoc sp. JL31]